PDYAVGLRATDGAPAVRLGRGATQAMSPDGKWVAASIFSTDQLVFYPTGPGDARILNVKPTVFQFNDWFPDSASGLLRGSMSGAKSRCYRQPIDGGAMTPVTPEGPFGGLVAANGTIVAGDDKHAFIYDPAGKVPPVPVKVDPAEWQAGLDSTGRGAFAHTRRPPPLRPS